MSTFLVLFGEQCVRFLVSENDSRDRFLISKAFFLSSSALVFFPTTSNLVLDQILNRVSNSSNASSSSLCSPIIPVALSSLFLFFTIFSRRNLNRSYTSVIHLNVSLFTVKFKFFAIFSHPTPRSTPPARFS